MIDAFLKKGLCLTAAVTLDPHQTDIFISGSRTVSLLRRMAAARHKGGDHRTSARAGWISRMTLQCLNGRVCFRAPRACPRMAKACAFSMRQARLRNVNMQQPISAARSRKPARVGAILRLFPGDGDSYAAALQMAMTRYMSVFQSAKSDLLTRPPMRLVTGALAVVTGGWRYEDLFGCLKTGLCALEPDEIDRLENYALTWRVRGKAAWNTDFTGHPDGYGSSLMKNLPRHWLRSMGCAAARLHPLMRLQTVLPLQKPRGQCAGAL